MYNDERQRVGTRKTAAQLHKLAQKEVVFLKAA